jgi:hydroxyacylglutathione hydrolase
VVGFDDRIPGLTHLLKDEDLFPVGQQKVRGLFTPCHTAGSAVYHVLSARKYSFSKSPNRNPHSILFSGDTLLVGGCGKFAEGNEKDMYNNLIHKIAPLPSDTDVYCGHEYTVQNLEFANQLLDKSDADVSEALDRAKVTRSAFVPTVPGVLEDEFLCNPFMRANHTAVMRATGCGLDRPASEVFRKLREKKNNFQRNEPHVVG